MHLKLVNTITVKSLSPIKPNETIPAGTVGKILNTYKSGDAWYYKVKFPNQDFSRPVKMEDGLVVY